MRRPDRIERKERGAAAVLLLEQADRVGAGALGIDDDVLRGGAEGGLHGESIAVVGAKEVRHGAVDALEGTALLLAHDGFDGLGIALIAALEILEHGEAGFGRAEIHREGGELRLRGAKRLIRALERVAPALLLGAAVV